MAKRKIKKYLVLKPVRSDKKGTYFAAGDTITSRDFMASIIAGWLTSDPPILKEIDGNEPEEVIPDGGDD